MDFVDGEIRNGRDLEPDRPVCSYMVLKPFSHANYVTSHGDIAHGRRSFACEKVPGSIPGISPYSFFTVTSYE